MKSEFKRVVDAQLSGVEWTNIHTENVLKRLEDEKMTKRISVKTLLIAAVLFVLTAAVAFAVVAITRSPEAEAMNTARTSVMEKYGLNAEAIAFMDGRYEKTDDGWKVVFAGGEKTGEYEVVFDGKTATAAWNYEGTEKASTAWKNDEIIAQLKKIGEYEKQRMTEYPETGEYLKPTIGDAADNVHMQDIIYAEPREGDLSEEKALEIYYEAAKDVISDVETLRAAGKPYMACVVNGEGRRMWEINRNFMCDGIVGDVSAYIDAVTGEVVKIIYETGGMG